MPPDPALRSALLGARLADLTAHTRRRRLLVLEADEPVSVALAALAARRVLSAPVVVRSEAQSPGSLELDAAGPPVSSVAGFVGVADVLAAVLESVGPGAATPAALDAAAATVCAAPLSSLVPGGLGAAREAATVGALADWRLAARADTTSLLDGAGRLLAPPPPAAPVHRLAVSDGGDPPRVAGVVSQSDVVAFIHAKGLLAAPSPAGSSPLPPPVPPVIVSVHDTTLTAFRAMRLAGVSGVAVVDSAGAACGSLSASDFRALSLGAMGLLNVPVGEFLSLRPLIAASTAQAAAETIDIAGPPAAAGVAADRATAAADASHAAAPALVSVGQGATLGDAVAALARARVHRVWRLGPSDEPIGVFTLTDALRAIVDAAGGVEA